MAGRCPLHPADCADPLCVSHGNPAELLAHHVLRPTARRLGLEVDEASVAAARDYCAELVLDCSVSSCQRHGRCMYLNHPRCGLKAKESS